MSSNPEILVDRLNQLIDDLLSHQIPAPAFEKQYMELWREARDSGAFRGLIADDANYFDRIFTAVDMYCADVSLRSTNELGDEELEREVARQEGLRRLVGGQLTSVQFVLDYLILGFDERGALTTLVWPKLEEQGHQTHFGMSGYRDKLCSLIKRTVRSASCDGSETICIQFKEGEELRIPLRSYEKTGERAILTGPQHFLLVF